MISAFVACLLLLLPGYVSLASGLKPSDQQCDGLEVIFSWVLISALVVSLSGLFLAEIGRFSLAGVLLLSVAYSVVVIVARRPNLHPLVMWRSLEWDHTHAVAVGVLIIAGMLFLPPFETILGGRDGGTYVNTGVHIAQTGGLPVSDEFFAALPKSVQAHLLWTFPHAPGFQFRYPGFYWLREEGLTWPQFFHLYPVWIALFYSALGLKGALFVTPLFAWLGGSGVYLVGRHLFSRGVGILSLILLTINPSQLWFARYANADVVLQFLFLSGILSWIWFLQRRHARWGFITSACFGAALLTKLDAVLLLPPLVLVLGYLAFRGRTHSFRVLLLPLGALVVWSALHARLFAWPYVTMSWGFYRGWLSREMLIALTGLAGILLTALLFRHTKPVQQAVTWLSSLQRPLTLILAGSILGLGIYLYFVLPQHLGPVYNVGGQPTQSYAEENFVRLGWYLTPLGLALATIGAAWVIAGHRNARASLLWLSALVFAAVNLRSSLIMADHVWAIRRYTSVVMPAAVLFAAYAINRFSVYISHFTPHISRLTPFLLAGFIVTQSVRVDWPLIGHQEFRGATAQVQALANFLPQSALVIFDNSWVGNFLAPPLKLIHKRETAVFWSETGKPSLKVSTAQTVADTGFRQGRDVFFVASTDSLPEFGPAYDVTLVRSEVLQVPQLEQTVDRFPQTIEHRELPYRIYHLQPGAGRREYEAEALHHQVGKTITDALAEWGEAHYADPATDEPGYLVYGPYASLSPGPYRVVFRVKTGTPVAGNGPVAVLDVAADSGRTTLAQRNIWSNDPSEPGLYQAFNLDFTNPVTQVLEFRVFFTGVAELWIDSVEIRRR